MAIPGEWAFAGLGVLVGAPLVGFLWHWVRLTRGSGTVCLMYHRLARRTTWEMIRGSERMFTLPVEEFEKQLDHLRTSGYRFLSADEVADCVEGRGETLVRSVLLTFDDGCQSVASLAAPVLEKYSAVATCFVTTDPSSYVFQLGMQGDPRMSDDVLRALDLSQVQIESHAVSHRPLRGLSSQEIRRELDESRRALEAIVHRPVRFLAVPGNWWNKQVMQIAREVGYRAVWISNPGVASHHSGLFGVPRVNVDGDMNLQQFITAISPRGIAQRIVVGWIKRLPARVCGPRLWYRLRSAIMRYIPGGYLSARRAAIVCLCILVTLAVMAVGSLLLSGG